MTRFASRLAGGIIITAATLVGMSSSAEAQTQVTGTTTGTNITKSVSLTCPAGFAPVGVTAQITGTPSAAFVSTATPLSATSASASATGFTTGNNWQLKATAFCLATQAGWQLVTGPWAGEGAGSMATCPAGKELVGGGFLGSSGVVARGALAGSTVGGMNNAYLAVTHINKTISTNEAMLAVGVCTNPDWRTTISGQFQWNANVTANVPVTTLAAPCTQGDEAYLPGWFNADVTHACSSISTPSTSFLIGYEIMTNQTKATSTILNSLCVHWIT